MLTQKVLEKAVFVYNNDLSGEVDFGLINDVVRGEEFICELNVRPKPKKAKKSTWKYVAKEEDAMAKKRQKV